MNRGRNMACLKKMPSKSENWSSDPQNGSKRGRSMTSHLDSSTRGQNQVHAGWDNLLDRRALGSEKDVA